MRKKNLSKLLVQHDPKYNKRRLVALFMEDLTKKIVYKELKILQVEHRQRGGLLNI